ncbi:MULTISPECIES: VOC family protein [Lysinibacillus]|uniref:VOC family protein n=1 Tax=Lysinibacillus TaxID=400634 RepID=UPI000B0EF18D|nr:MULTISPECIES: VOC family protein [Lysinibacillus]
MEFRLELFVEDLHKSINFYEEILGLTFYKKTDMSAMIKTENFALLLTTDQVFKEDHYF